jgi:hypothetical protein
MVTNRATGDIVAAPTNCDLEVLVDRETEGIDDIGNPGATGDHRGALIDHSIVHATCRLVAVIGGKQQMPRKGLREVRKG